MKLRVANLHPYSHNRLVAMALAVHTHERSCHNRESGHNHDASVIRMLGPYESGCWNAFSCKPVLLSVRPVTSPRYVSCAATRIIHNYRLPHKFHIICIYDATVKVCCVQLCTGAIAFQRGFEKVRQAL
jgi:hypothetical protein